MSLRQYKTATLALGQSSGKFPFLVSNCVLECLSFFLRLFSKLAKVFFGGISFLEVAGFDWLVASVQTWSCWGMFFRCLCRTYRRLRAQAGGSPNFFSDIDSARPPKIMTLQAFFFFFFQKVATI